MNEPDPIERDRQARDIFLRAAEMPSAEAREDYLAEACREDEALRARVLKLLESHQQDSFLEGPVDLRPITEKLGDRIGRYKLLQQLGEGGMGVVYMAEQEEPVRRRVALKIIKLGMDTKQVVARFEAERQALALMDHPNIARVLDAGATDAGRPYFVMELVQGVPITEFCDKNQLSTEQRLKLFIPVCQAVQSAHQKGIIHRDLKPTNILVSLNPDGMGVPKVIDFGVAKATNQKLTEKTLFTAHGMMVGTPAYMSPEQAEMSNLDVDTRSDIYSLGALLYELLTGSPPFPEQRLRSAGYNEMQRIILEEEPERPSTRLSTLQGEQRRVVARNRGASELALGRGFPSDLDWIVMKCLGKDRARRYDTVVGLARDIERHLNHEPIVARPPSRLYEFQKTVRRHWVGFAAVGAVLVASALGVVVSTLEAVRARQTEQHERKVVYAAKIGQMQAAWEQNRVARVHQLLEETAGYPDRGFEWYYWQRQTHLPLMTLRGHLGGIGCVEFSPDSKRVATGSQDRTVIVWDVATGSELLTLTGHLHEVDSVAFSSDGRRIASAGRDHTARIWDAQSGKQLLILEGHTGRIEDVVFSPDDQQVLTASWDGTARIWDAATGSTLVKLEGHLDPLNDAAFSPDGLRVVTVGDDKIGRVWDVLTGKVLFSLTGHGGGIHCVAFSRDGRRIVTGGDEPDPTAKVWDAATGDLLFTLAGHAGRVNGIRFSSDSRRIVTCSEDQTARVWDAVAGKGLFSLKGHTDAVGDVAISPDGSRIVTGGYDGTVRLWDAASDRQELTLRGHAGAVLAAAFSRDGRRIVTGSVDNTAAVWDAVTGERLFVLAGRHKDAVRSVAFSPDGRRILTGSVDQTAKVWDAAQGNYLFTLAGHSGPVSRVAFSPDGRFIATGSADKTAGVWESNNGKRLLTLAGHTERIIDLVFSPNSRLLATASADQTAKFWDTVTGRELFELRDTGIVAAVAFSPDATRIATTCWDGNARGWGLPGKLWDAASHQQLLTFRGHIGLARGVAFSPDGRRIVTAGNDRTARVWDTATGEELLTLKGHADNVTSVSFTPDGHRILTSSSDVTAKVWDAALPEEFARWQNEERNAAERLTALAQEDAARGQQARASSVQDPGAIKKWLVVGPLMFEGHDGARAVAREQAAGEAHLRPRAGQRLQGSDLVWRVIELPDYVLDCQKLYGIYPPWTVTYLACYIQSESDQTGLMMVVGSEDQSKVYLNGKEIYRCEKPRKFVPDQDVITTGVELAKGVNVLVFKMVNEDDAPHASVRFADAAGRPLNGIRVTLTPPSGG